MCGLHESPLVASGLGVHENIAHVVLTVDAYLCPPGWSAPHDVDEELHLWFFHGGQQAGIHLDVLGVLFLEVRARKISSPSSSLIFPSSRQKNRKTTICEKRKIQNAKNTEI